MDRNRRVRNKVVEGEDKENCNDKNFPAPKRISARVTRSQSKTDAKSGDGKVTMPWNGEENFTRTNVQMPKASANFK